MMIPDLCSRLRMIHDTLDTRWAALFWVLWFRGSTFLRYDVVRSFRSMDDDRLCQVPLQSTLLQSRSVVRSKCVVRLYVSTWWCDTLLLYSRRPAAPVVVVIRTKRTKKKNPSPQQSVCDIALLFVARTGEEAFR